MGSAAAPMRVESEPLIQAFRGATWAPPRLPSTVPRVGSHSQRDVRRRITATLTAALAIYACPALPLAAQPPQPDSTTPRTATFPTDAEVHAILAKRIADKKARGIAVALIAADGTVRFVSAGDSGQVARAKIDADTVFEIGSITKTFTGTLLAQAVTSGEIALNGKVRDYAPAQYKFRDSSRGSAGDITLLQLATHTSGLPRLPLSMAFAFAMLRDPGNPYKNYSIDAMWKFVADEKTDTTKTHPSQYSNLGVGLLGDLLAHKAGLSYAALVKRQILDPLAMTNTDSGDNLSPNPAPHLAIGHSEKLNVVSYWTFGAMSGAGALRSSTRDMARYINAQKSGTLAGAFAAQSPHARVSDQMDVGLCWMILKRHNDEIVWHNGGTGGFRSFAGFSKKSGLGVVVLSNSANDVDDIGIHLLNPANLLK